MDFFYANLRVSSYLCIALWSTPCMSRTSTRSLIDQTVRPWTILSNLALDWLNPCNAHSASALGRIYLTWKESKQNTQDKIRGSLESQHISRPWVCVISNLDGQNLREDSNKRHHPYCPPSSSHLINGVLLAHRALEVQSDTLCIYVVYESETFCFEACSQTCLYLYHMIWWLLGACKHWHERKNPWQCSPGCWMQAPKIWAVVSRPNPRSCLHISIHLKTEAMSSLDKVSNQGSSFKSIAQACRTEQYGTMALYHRHNQQSSLITKRWFCAEAPILVVMQVE